MRMGRRMGRRIGRRMGRRMGMRRMEMRSMPGVVTQSEVPSFFHQDSIHPVRTQYSCNRTHIYNCHYCEEWVWSSFALHIRGVLNTDT